MYTAYISDLTHIVNGVTTARYFPLASGYLASYAKKHFGDTIDVEIFKYVEDLDKAFDRKIPNFLCMSIYSWNFHLAYTFAKRAKEIYPEIITIFGGPNFPTCAEEQVSFLKKYSAIDFFIYGEGEEAFVGLLEKLMEAELNSSHIKDQAKAINNCCFLRKESLIRGEEKRIGDVNEIPSPYLTEFMDPFFKKPLIPLFETTRGCPFLCIFCYSGHDSQSRVTSFKAETIANTLEYIGTRVQDCDELSCADLNFGMYPADIQTAQVIGELQKDKGYPKIFSAYAGKNKPERVMEAAQLLNGSWGMGAAFQSADPEILKAIKRTNISQKKLVDYVGYSNKNDSCLYFELIVGLPLDTKEKHFDTLRLGLEAGLNDFKIYQLTLLFGTEIANLESRAKYGYVTRWRIMPRCFGKYMILGKEFRVAEKEEIVEGHNTMPVEDLHDCRLMDFLIEVFINSGWFEEVMILIRKFDFSTFDFIVFIKAHPEFFFGEMDHIIEKYKKLGQTDLFETDEKIEAFISSPGIIDQHLKGERGLNELNICKALSYKNLEDVFQTLYQGAIEFFKFNEICTEEMESYLLELKRFSYLRKFEFDNMGQEIYESFHYDFKDIHAKKYDVNPNQLNRSNTYSLRFYHEKDQASQLKNLLKIHGDSLSGWGKIFQAVNARIFNRKFNNREL